MGWLFRSVLVSSELRLGLSVWGREWAVRIASWAAILPAGLTIGGRLRAGGLRAWSQTATSVNGTWLSGLTVDCKTWALWPKAPQCSCSLPWRTTCNLGSTCVDGPKCNLHKQFASSDYTCTARGGASEAGFVLQALVISTITGTKRTTDRTPPEIFTYSNGLRPFAKASATAESSGIMTVAVVSSRNLPSRGRAWRSSVFPVSPRPVPR